MARDTHKAVFMLGGPGAGKTWIRNRRYADLYVLDADEIKQEHPDYDPANPAALHAWSADELARRFISTIADGSSFVYDGTGSTAERYVAYIRQAQALGYNVTVCYVRVDLHTALTRNATRKRTVPESVVREKHSLIATSFEIVSAVADQTVVIDNT